MCSFHVLENAALGIVKQAQRRPPVFQFIVNIHAFRYRQYRYWAACIDVHILRVNALGLLQPFGIVLVRHIPVVNVFIQFHSEPKVNMLHSQGLSHVLLKNLHAKVVSQDGIQRLQRDRKGP